MNIHITYALLAVFATILIAPAYGQGASPITVSTDSDTYDHESKIFVTGSVETIRSGTPITYKVTSPINSVVTVGQNDVNDDGMFEFMLNTKGDTWKYDGEYVIRVQYGNPDVNNWAIVNLYEMAVYHLLNLILQNLRTSSNKYFGLRDHMYHCPWIRLLVMHLVHMLEQLELW